MDTGREPVEAPGARTDMIHLTALVLLHHFLLVVHSAPLGSADLTLDLTDVAEPAKTLVQKLLRDIPAAHAAAAGSRALSLDSSQPTNLLLMAQTLALPAAPLLKKPSENFTLDMCVSHMLAGCQMFHSLLAVLSEKLDGLMDLKATVRDLVTHITKMKETVGLDLDASEALTLDVASRLGGVYEAQVAAHLTLMQLRSFCHDLSRSLKAINSYRRSAA